MEHKLIWVKPENQLPEDYKQVIVATNSGAVFTGFCVETEQFFKFYMENGVTVDDMVTYWTDMPKHPDKIKNR